MDDEVRIKRLDGGIVLEDDEIDTYEALYSALQKLVRNIDGLGSATVSDGDVSAKRKEGLRILKQKYPKGYENLVADIKRLSRQFIKEYCFSIFFFQDAADSMLIDTPKTLKGYVSERSNDISKALFSDYSMDEFMRVSNEIREKIVDLALINWYKHKDLSRGKR